MKILNLVLGLMVGIFFASCEDDDITTIGGSTDLPTNQVGYKYDFGGSAGGMAISSDFDATVVDKEGDVVEILLEGNIPSEYDDFLSKYADVLPSSEYVTEDGEVSVKGKFINSTKGVAYVNAKGEQSVLIDYDMKVGDSWTYTTRGGKKITRKVVAKSTEDDYFWGGMIIKTIDVEQNLPYPGFSKAFYYTNHKFGIVGGKVIMEDGKVAILRIN